MHRESVKKCHGKDCPNKDKAYKLFRVKHECAVHQYSLDNLCIDCEAKEDDIIFNSTQVKGDVIASQEWLLRKL